MAFGDQQPRGRAHQRGFAGSQETAHQYQPGPLGADTGERRRSRQNLDRQLLALAQGDRPIEPDEVARAPASLLASKPCRRAAPPIVAVAFVPCAFNSKFCADKLP